ncbi:MAG: hypothetical protein KatS3mg057_0420 [Herpetosiphonaceae bacterium]|nr:MAG: hypothetical protein KatS3mg057_0420 [Herpetosiphonaceae bacterium]
MVWKFFSLRVHLPSNEETDILLRQVLHDLCDQEPAKGGWERLHARMMTAASLELHTPVNTTTAEERRTPFMAMSFYWEALIRPQAWSRLTL